MLARGALSKVNKCVVEGFATAVRKILPTSGDLDDHVAYGLAVTATNF